MNYGKAKKKKLSLQLAKNVFGNIFYLNIFSLYFLTQKTGEIFTFGWTDKTPQEQNTRNGSSRQRRRRRFWAYVCSPGEWGFWLKTEQHSLTQVDFCRGITGLFPC